MEWGYLCLLPYRHLSGGCTAVPAPSHACHARCAADGRALPDIAPLGGGFGGMLWGSAGITVPWECYQQYGDTALLSEHYTAMKRYIQYIIDQTIETETNLIVQTVHGVTCATGWDWRMRRMISPWYGKPISSTTWI